VHDCPGEVVIDLDTASSAFGEVIIRRISTKIYIPDGVEVLKRFPGFNRVMMLTGREGVTILQKETFLELQRPLALISLTKVQCYRHVCERQPHVPCILGGSYMFEVTEHKRTLLFTRFVIWYSPSLARGHWQRIATHDLQVRRLYII
jgi:hypothetical protein